MGARVAAELATISDLTNQFIFGVACLSYPLHPPRKPDELRMSSLIHLGIPVLLINGTKDPFCRKDLMDNVLDKMGSDWKMHWVEKADHSLNVNNKQNNEVIDMICEWVVKWCQSVFMAER
jgi:predicted alpha/beta-hydrolase family hydrolase